MKMQKKHEGNSERWLLTYSDLITLLMILFVLLYAISNVNQDKYDKLADSLSESLGNGSNGSLSGSVSVLPGGLSVLLGVEMYYQVEIVKNQTIQVIHQISIMKVAVI